MRGFPLEEDGRGDARRLRRGVGPALTGAAVALLALGACEAPPAEVGNRVAASSGEEEPAGAADGERSARAGDVAPAGPDAAAGGADDAPATPRSAPTARSPAGTWARYTTASDAEPLVSDLVLACPSPGDADERLWLGIEATGDGRRVVALSLLVDDLGFLATGGAPAAARYLVHPAAGPALEFVDARDGSALLPATAAGLFPRGEPGDPWPAAVRFLGRDFVRAGDGAAPSRLPRTPAETLRLDPDRLVATSRPFREAGPERTRQEGKRYADYEYVDFSAADYARMIEAGFTLFRVPHAHVDHVVDEPVFLVADKGFRERPDLLFRSNYRGAVMYLDEPALRVHAGSDFLELPGAEACARFVCESVSETLRSSTGYGAGYLGKRIAEAGLYYGDVRQAPYPAWEAIASAAWYDLEGGADGVCWQAQLVPERFSREIRETLGVDFPADPRACIDFHVALLRGAARRFDRPWGVSVYGQTDAATADVLFPRAWDAGATYFWMWSSHGDYHVPHARQLELSRRLHEHARANPRGSGAREISRRARIALVLPWGYLFDDYAFGWGSRSKEGRLWRNERLRLDRRNGAGATYGEVLATAMREAVGLLERGEPWDVLFLREDERAEGYPDVRRVRPDATITRTP